MTTFTPDPGAAPLSRMVFAQARMETRLLVRNGEQLILAVAIPLIVLVGAVAAAKRIDHGFSHSPVDTLVPGVFALAIMSTAFTSLAITTGFERRYGVLKRLGSSPLPRTGLLAGKVGALLIVELMQLALIAIVGVVLGWSPSLSAAGLAGFLVSALLGTAAFASLGLFVAGVFRAEATLAVANLIYLLLLVGGAVVLPASSYGAFGRVAELLPSGALGEAMRESFLDGSFPTVHLVVLAAWTTVGAVLTARSFSWE